ncbi:unnamed protein product [Calypogeia fissa]
MAPTMTAAACGCIVSSPAPAVRHCGPSSSPNSASSYYPTSSSSLLQNVFRAKNRTRYGPLSRKLSHERAFGTLRVEHSWAGAVRASRRGDDNRDDAGVIKDMEMYLDDLSLEYDSVWDTKPAWCQPWTIVGTGMGVIAASWLPFHNAFVSGGVTLLIGLWWYSFLYMYPLGYSEMIAERRRLVENGSEDTYGRKTAADERVQRP